MDKIKKGDIVFNLDGDKFKVLSVDSEYAWIRKEGELGFWDDKGEIVKRKNLNKGRYSHLKARLKVREDDLQYWINSVKEKESELKLLRKEFEALENKGNKNG